MLYIENCHNVTLQKVKKKSSERESNDWGINLAIKNTAGESSDQGIGKRGESSDGKNDIESKPKGCRISLSIHN